jgi:hypothetical protein
MLIYLEAVSYQGDCIIQCTSRWTRPLQGEIHKCTPYSIFKTYKQRSFQLNSQYIIPQIRYHGAIVQCWLIYKEQRRIDKISATENSVTRTLGSQFVLEKKMFQLAPSSGCYLQITTLTSYSVICLLVHYPEINSL